VRNEGCAVQRGNPQSGKGCCASYDDYPDHDDYGEYDDCVWVTDDELGDLAPVPLVENGGDLDEYMLSDCEEPGGPCQGCVHRHFRFSVRIDLDRVPRAEASAPASERAGDLRAHVAAPIGGEAMATPLGGSSCCRSAVTRASLRSSRMREEPSRTLAWWGRFACRRYNCHRAGVALTGNRCYAASA
jgi:hypothetical protein